MSNTESEGGPSRDETPVELEAGVSTQRLGAELFAHGLLELTHRGSEAAREQRIERVLGALDGEEAARQRWRIPARWVLAAAVLAVAVAAFLLDIPWQSSAQAVMHESIAAQRAAGDRRYEVWVEGWNQPGRQGAVIDTRSPGLLVVFHRPPQSPAPVVVGRDERGQWAARPDGSVETANPRRYWPPFSVDGQTLMVDSVDRVLEQLQARYEFERAGQATLEGHSGAFERVTATRADRAGPIPHTVNVWIDPRTRLVERIEMLWDEPAAGRELRLPPPLKAIVFENVPPPKHPEGWFTREFHAKK